MGRIIIAAILLSASTCFGWGVYPVPMVYQGGPAFTYDYCVREDGVASLGSATDCTTAITSMSPTTFNASSFSAGDVVVFSSRGGTIDTPITIPSGGSSGNPITYIGEPGNIATISNDSSANITVGYSYVTLTDLISSLAGTYGVRYINTIVGNETNNLIITDPTSEGVRHEGNVTVTHNNLSISGVGEPLTTHSTTGGTITINDSTFTGYDSNGAVRGAPGSTTSWVINRSTFTAGTGGVFISGTYMSSGAIAIDSCRITDNATIRGWDLRSLGVLTLKNSIISGGTTGDYYILPKVGSVFYNNTFFNIGVSAALIFNNVSITAKNNIFDTIGVTTFYGTTGTIDSNCFYSAGTARGTNAVTSDPVLDANGKLTASSTPVFDAGVGPSSDASVPTTDFDGDTRSGTTCDIGADEY